MNKHLIKLAAASAVALAGVSTAHAQVGVGVSIGFNQPGVYGRIDVGNAGPAALVYPQPVVIEPTPYAVHQRPIYLYVPDAYTHDWRHHCAAYGACGQPVYFVQDQWVRQRYAEHYPHWQERGAPGYFHPYDRHDHGPYHDDRGHDREHEHDHDHRDGR